MKNELKSVEILDSNEINEIKLKNEKIDAELMKKRYTSVTEDKSRTAKLVLKSTIKKDLENVKNIFLDILIKNLHPNLSLSDIKENSYYRTSGKMNKVPFEITKFDNDIFEITWYTEKQKFIKQIKIYNSLLNKNTTIIRFTSIVIGMESIETYFEKRIKNVYQSREKIAFKIDILKLKMRLDVIKESKFENTNKQIERMIRFSKSLY